MITAIRTELLKLRTTRLAAGMLAVAAGWTALVAAIEASRAGPGGMVPASPPAPACATCSPAPGSR